MLSEATAAKVAHVLLQQPQALLIIGEPGSGKTMLARHLSEQLMQSAPVLGLSLHLIAPEDNGSITIEQIRALRSALALKLPKQQSQSSSSESQRQRVVIIEAADTMGEEAQNALLKLLEEPPSDTAIILLTTPQAPLLPTIQSRVARLPVHPLTKREAKAAFADFDQQQLDKAYHISRGNIGLLKALLLQNDHPLLEQMTQAKQLLAKTPYERLIDVDPLSKSAELNQLMYCLKLLLHYHFRTNSTQRSLHRLEACLQAEQDLLRRVNKKIILTDLFIKM